MDKIWILKRNRQTKNYRVFKTETELLKAISPGSNQEVLEYELTSGFKAADFFKERERDIQLRSVLGELEKSEEIVIDLINAYIKLAPEGKVWKIYYKGNEETSTKKEYIKKLKKYQSDKKEIARMLVNNKRYFIKDVSNEVEWYKVLLKVHNFRDYKYDPQKWDHNTKKYTIIDTSTEELRNNFALAKKEIKKK